MTDLSDRDLFNLLDLATTRSLYAVEPGREVAAAMLGAGRRLLWDGLTDPY